VTLSGTRIVWWSLVAGLLLVHAVLALNSIQGKSNTFDETGHLTSGYIIWKYNDYRHNPESGNFYHRLIALPLLTMDINPPDTESDFWKRSDVWRLAHEFFYKQGNPAEEMLWRGRCVTVFVSVLFGFLVFIWSSRLFGNVGGLLSLTLYVFSPTVLAHCRLATIDCAVGFFMVLALGLVWRVMHRVSLIRVLLLGLSVSALLLTKYSGLLIIPISICLLIIRLLLNKPLLVKLPSLSMLRIRNRFHQLGVLTGVGLIVGVIIYISIWASFGFRYSVSSDFDTDTDSLYWTWEKVMEDSGGPGDLINTFANAHLLPEGYLYGFAYTLNRSKHRNSFFRGEYSLTGFALYFPLLFLMKTPVTSLCMIASGLLGFIFYGVTNRRGRRLWYATLPLTLLLILYSWVALSANLNIGHRHIAMLYPLLFILTGVIVRCFWCKLIKYKVIPICLFLFIVESQSIYPHILSPIKRTINRDFVGIGRPSP